MKNGTEIGKYIIHFENGTTESIPLIYGHNVGNIVMHPQIPLTETESAALVEINSSPTNSKGNAKTQPIYHFEWMNPNPDRRITHLEFQSARKTAAPILLGITAEP